MVAQESLELFVMVRIHAGQPVSSIERAIQPSDILSTQESPQSKPEKPVRFPMALEHLATI